MAYVLRIFHEQRIIDGTQYHLLGTDHAERKFSINYRSSDNALVFSKAFGTAT